jgi:hypothetical protein
VEAFAPHDGPEGCLVNRRRLEAVTLLRKERQPYRSHADE